MRNGDDSAAATDPRHRLAEIIREARIASGEKQESFARLIGVVPAHLSRLENGQGLPSLRLIERITNNSHADRMEMRRVLRRIKGFDDDAPQPLTASACEEGMPVNERVIPVFSKMKAFEQWTTAVLDARRPPKVERHFPVDERMTNDPTAFWFEVRDPLLACPGIAIGDLLLVEPSHPVARGLPCFVRLGPKFLIARWCHEGDDCVTLEPVAGGTDRPQTITKLEFEQLGGTAFRIAGIHPCYRPFVAARAMEATASL